MELSNQKQTPIAYEQVRQKKEHVQLVRDIVNQNIKLRHINFAALLAVTANGMK